MTTFAWHVHHDVLVEPLTAPLEERIAYIKYQKPKKEHDLRLRLLHKVKGELPSEFGKARAAFDKARAAFDKAWAAFDRAQAAFGRAEAAYGKPEAAFGKALAAYDKARAAFDKAQAAFDKEWAANLPAISALHSRECPDCPWDGETIFACKAKEVLPWV